LNKELRTLLEKKLATAPGWEQEKGKGQSNAQPGESPSFGKSERRKKGETLLKPSMKKGGEGINRGGKNRAEEKIDQADQRNARVSA